MTNNIIIEFDLESQFQTDSSSDSIPVLTRIPVLTQFDSDSDSDLNCFTRISNKYNSTDKLGDISNKRDIPMDIIEPDARNLIENSIIMSMSAIDWEITCLM